LGYEVRTSLEYNPEQNGLVEMYIGEMKRVLNKRLKGRVSEWGEVLSAVQKALNESGGEDKVSTICSDVCKEIKERSRVAGRKGVG